MKTNNNNYINGGLRGFYDPTIVYPKTTFEQVIESADSENPRNLAQVLEGMNTNPVHCHDDRYYTKTEIDNKISVGTDDLEEGSSKLESGKLYIVIAD